MDAGEIRYVLNGDDLGVAFTNVDISKPWSPVVSLTSSETCRFIIGDSSLNRLRYIPGDYISIGMAGVASNSPQTAPPLEEVQPQDLAVNTEAFSSVAELIGSLSVSPYLQEAPYFQSPPSGEIYGPPNRTSRQEIPAKFDESETLSFYYEINWTGDTKPSLMGVTYGAETIFLTIDKAKDTVTFSRRNGGGSTVMAHLNFGLGESDVLGCGEYMLDGSIFFTCNGTKIGDSISRTRTETVGSLIPYVKAKYFVLNLGFHGNFKYRPANANLDYIVI